MLAQLEPKGLFVNNSRKNVIQEVEASLRSVVAGKAKNTGSFCLMGSKGCGKTTLLQFLAETIPVRFPSVITILVENITELKAEKSLIPLITRKLKIEKEQAPETMKDVSRILKEANRKLFVILDDFDEYYKQVGYSVVGEIFAIGNNRESTMKAMISGSAAILRDLVYANLVKAEYPMYVGYQGVNLNDQKFIPLNLYAAESYEEYLMLRQHNHDKQLPENPSTEGEPTATTSSAEKSEEGAGRLLEKWKHEYQYFSGSIRELNDNLEENFHKILSKLRNKSHQTLLVVDNFRTSKTIIIDELKSAEINEVYKLADLGILKITHSANYSDVAMAIEALGKFSLKETTGLTFHEQVVLFQPASDNGTISESLLFRSLAERKWNNLSYNGRVLHVEKSIAEKKIFVSQSPVEAPVEVTFASIQDEIFKEHPDRYGADGIAFSADGVRRIQVKLGSTLETEVRSAKKEFGQDDLVTIASKLYGGQQKLLPLLQAVYGKTPAIQSFLTTTRPLKNAEKAKEYLAKGFTMTILGKEDLFELWSNAIKEFDEKLRLGVYTKL